MNVTDVDRIRNKFNEDEQVTFPREDVATLLIYISMLEKVPTILCSEWEYKEHLRTVNEEEIREKLDYAEGQ